MRLAILIVSCLGAGELPRLGRSGLALTARDGAIVVLQIEPGSSAAQVGIAVGDVVVSADGRPALATAEFARSLIKQSDGTDIALEVRRNGKTLSKRLHFAAPPQERHAGITVDYGVIDVNGHLRRALITRPPGEKRHPLIVWIAGSGCGSQESSDGSLPEVQLLYALTRLGFATVRVEKTGTGDSQGPPCYSESGGFDQEVEGYRSAIQALHSDASIDPGRIFLFGHSAGATLAPLVARGLPVRGIVLNGAMSGGFFDYILSMRRREARLARTPAEAAVHERCLRRLLIDGIPAAEIEREMPECRRKVRFDSPPSYTNDWLRLDLARAWREAPSTSVLVLYGTGDFVTSEELSKGLVALINAAHPGKATLRMLPMDHGLRGYRTQQRAFDAGRNPGGARLLDGLARTVEKFLNHASS